MVPSVLFEQKIEKINLNGEEYSDNTIFKVFKSEMMKFQVLKPKYSKFHVFSRPGDKIMKFHVFSMFFIIPGQSGNPVYLNTCTTCNTA